MERRASNKRLAASVAALVTVLSALFIHRTPGAARAAWPFITKATKAVLSFYMVGSQAKDDIILALETTRPDNEATSVQDDHIDPVSRGPEAKTIADQVADHHLRWPPNFTGRTMINRHLGVLTTVGRLKLDGVIQPVVVQQRYLDAKYPESTRIAFTETDLKYDGRAVLEAYPVQ